METCANVNISWWVNDWAFLHGSDVTGPVSLKGSRFPSGKLFITAIHERSLSSDANSSSVEGSRAFLFPEFFKYLNMLKREWVAFDLLGDLLHLIFDDNLSGRFLISKLNWFYFYLGPTSHTLFPNFQKHRWQPGVPRSPHNRDSSVPCLHTNQFLRP